MLPLTFRAVGHLRTAKKARSLKAQDDLETLRTELESMHNKFLLMEDLKANEDVDMLKELLKQAYSIKLNGTSLIQRLENIGLDTEIVNSKEIRQLNKLANYWRISESLIRTCRAYRKYFSNMDLQTLIPYKHSLLLGKRRFVHAEIQILIHLDASEENTRPRVIGVSKEACFLCDSFVLSHGGFFVSNAHKMIYEQWTIPERDDYHPSTLNRIQSALAKVNTRVVEATIDARAATAKYAFPNQSSINLVSVCIRNPSISTILSAGSRENTRSEMRKQIAASGEKHSAATSYASTPINSGELIEQLGTMIPQEHDGQSSSHDREEILIIQSDVLSTSSILARSPGANERTGTLLYDGPLEAGGLCVDTSSFQLYFELENPFEAHTAQPRKERESSELLWKHWLRVEIVPRVKEIDQPLCVVHASELEISRDYAIDATQCNKDQWILCLVVNEDSVVKIQRTRYKG